MSGTLVHSGLVKIEWLDGLILHIRNGLKVASVCMASKRHLQRALSKSVLEYVLVECCVPYLQLSAFILILAFFCLRVAAPTNVLHLSQYFEWICCKLNCYFSKSLASVRIVLTYIVAWMRILLFLLAIFLSHYHQTLRLSHLVGSRNATANCMNKEYTTAENPTPCLWVIIKSVKRYNQNCYWMEVAKAESRALRFTRRYSD